MCLYILCLGTRIELGPEGSTSVEINHVPIEMQPKEVRYVASSAIEGTDVHRIVNLLLVSLAAGL